MAAQFNIPAQPTKYVTRYQKFRGVDFSTDPALVDASRSPFAPNLISDAGGMPEKRPGWRTLKRLTKRINGIFEFQIGEEDFLIVHSGDTLYCWQPEQDKLWPLKSPVNDGRSQAFFMEEALYILTGEEYVRIRDKDGKPWYEGSAAFAYVPTTRIGASPSGGGTAYEQVNLLTGKRKNTFCADGTSTVYHLDAENLDSDAVTATVNGAARTEGTHFTVDRAKGTATFKTAPAKGEVSGRDNVEIIYSKAGEGYADKVCKCTICTTYADRAWISGNPKDKNTDWRSGFQDPTYFPDLGYSHIGSETPIMGYAKIGEYLAIVKRDDSQASTIFLRREDTMNGETVFPVKQGVTGAGAVSPYSFGQILGEPLFLSNNGILGLVSSTVTDEKAVQNRSYYIDAQLLKEPGLKTAAAVSWNGYYLLAVNNKCYIMDGRQGKSYKSQSMGDYLFECYHWENIPASCWMEHNGALYFGTEDGRLCRFNTDIEGIYKYNDDGAAISCAWSTKADDDGHFTQYKSLTKRGSGVMIKPYLRSSVKVLVRTQRDFGQQIRYATMDIFDWEDIDFERFTFNNSDAPQVVPFNRKVKKYITLQITVRNDVLNEGFGIYGIVKQFTKGNSVK